MSEHVSEWLGAYHDGELHGARLRLVESHLATCQACQAELAELQGLSRLLQETPVEDPLRLTGERAATQIVLRLPRQVEQPRRSRFLELGWLLLPVGLLGALVFLQVTDALSTAALLMGQAWLPERTAQAGWVSAVLNLAGDALGEAGQAALEQIGALQVGLRQLAWRLIPQAVVALAYLGWLLAWWLQEGNHRQAEPGSE